MIHWKPFDRDTIPQGQTVLLWHASARRCVEGVLWPDGIFEPSQCRMHVVTPAQGWSYQDNPFSHYSLINAPDAVWVRTIDQVSRTARMVRAETEPPDFVQVDKL